MVSTYIQNLQNGSLEGYPSKDTPKSVLRRARILNDAKYFLSLPDMHLADAVQASERPMHAAHTFDAEANKPQVSDNMPANVPANVPATTYFTDLTLADAVQTTERPQISSTSNSEVAVHSVSALTPEYAALSPEPESDIINKVATSEQLNLAAIRQTVEGINRGSQN